jgi:hypothetical protein
LPPIQITSLVSLTSSSVLHWPGAGDGPALELGPGVGVAPLGAGVGVVPGGVTVGAAGVPVGAGVGVGAAPPFSHIFVPSQPAAVKHCVKRHWSVSGSTQSPVASQQKAPSGQPAHFDSASLHGLGGGAGAALPTTHRSSIRQLPFAKQPLAGH